MCKILSLTNVFKMIKIKAMMIEILYAGTQVIHFCFIEQDSGKRPSDWSNRTWKYNVHPSCWWSMCPAISDWVLGRNFRPHSIIHDLWSLFDICIWQSQIWVKFILKKNIFLKQKKSFTELRNNFRKIKNTIPYNQNSSFHYNKIFI